jgi:Protein of unknown function (DUF3592)
MLFGVALSLVALARVGWQASLLVACAFVLFPGVSAWLTQIRIHGIRAIQHRFPVDVTTFSAAIGAQAPEKLRDVQYMERPRRVRLRPRGWLYSLGVAAFALALIYLPHLIFRDEPVSRHSGKGLLVIAAFVFYFFLCVSYFRNRWREYRLLSDGRPTNGFVLEQHERSRSLPQISYAFRDLGGRESRAKVTDFSRQLFEGMPVTVFYDEADPVKSVTLEGSLFRVDRID